MKNICLLLGLCAFIQTARTQDSLVLVTSGKTSSLLFPASITYVDRGKPELLVQRVKEAENLLLIKAATTQLPETNLSVVTSDGKFYSFTVRYDSMPSQLIYPVGKTMVHLNSNVVDENELVYYATMILDNGRKSMGMTAARWGMLMRVNGIYSKESVLFFHLVLSNGSPIDYELDYLRLFIKDTKKAKRTAIQEKEIIPLKTIGNKTKIKAGHCTSIVLALPRFTIPRGQHLVISAGEKNGGRNLDIKVKNKNLVKARLLPLLDGNQE